VKVSDIDGVLFFSDVMPPAAVVADARRLEELGYGSLWLPDLFGRELFVTAAYLLAATTRIRVATGIANIYARDAISAAQGARTLSELYDGRFILGLGVSHPPAAEARGHRWEPPVKKLGAYLEGIARAHVSSPEPTSAAPIFVAAHGPKLLALAAEHADGANTYLMPPAHTREAREILGEGKQLNVVLPCCLCPDAATARKVGRKALAMYRKLPAYQRQWARFGFDASDTDGDGSDRLVDTIVAWGDEAALRARIAEHIDAGADRIILLPYQPAPQSGERAWELLEALAPGAR
jgi:probable F420-dependent oxidoreductase